MSEKKSAENMKCNEIILIMQKLLKSESNIKLSFEKKNGCNHKKRSLICFPGQIIREKSKQVSGIRKRIVDVCRKKMFWKNASCKN